MTLPDLLNETAQKNGSSLALIFRDEKWSYRKLYESAHQVAAALRELGIQRGDRVALLLKNSPEFVITLFALSLLGASAVPMNFLQTPAELETICADAGASGLVTQSAFLESVQSFRLKLRSLKFIAVTDLALKTEHSEVKAFSAFLQRPFSELVSECEENEPIIILYTSGTTGKAKGVLLSHKNLISNALAAIRAFGLTPREKFICILPMFHVFAWTCNVLVPIRLGCPIVIVESVRPPKAWLKLMFKHKITVFQAVPQIYSVLAEQAKGFKQWILKYIFFGAVRFCISGAAPLTTDVFNSFQKKFGKMILEGYGLTETSPLVSVNTPSAKKIGSVGKPIEGIRVKITDPQEKEVPVGEEGEICIRGENVTEGYFNQPEETMRAFTQDGWFKTGDVGSVDSEGFLYIRDRIKDMIIVKGLKVFSAQVETVLLSHPAVAEAAVVGMPNPDGDETIKGFVVLKERSQIDKMELFKLCQEKLPAYKRPKEIEIRKELPKNALQKILKRELRKGGCLNEKIQDSDRRG